MKIIRTDKKTASEGLAPLWYFYLDSSFESEIGLLCDKCCNDRCLAAHDNLEAVTESEAENLMRESGNNRFSEFCCMDCNQ
jgi:hypothetical protein